MSKSIPLGFNTVVKVFLIPVPDISLAIEILEIWKPCRISLHGWRNNQAVKLHSLKIKAPADKGPKTVSEPPYFSNIIKLFSSTFCSILQLRIFINQPTTLDFDKADQMTATQVQATASYPEMEITKNKNL